MATKKELEIYHKEGSHLYSLRFVNGGELPDMLKSDYTSRFEAAKWRDMYYAAKLPKKSQEVA